MVDAVTSVMLTQQDHRRYTECKSHPRNLMQASDILYRDVSNDPSAEEKALHAPELRQALLDCGFRRVGLLETYSHQRHMPPMILNSNSPDAQLIKQALEQGEVDEILTSSDQHTLGSIERFFGGPVVILRTIFENGVIVDTTTKPARRPEFGGTMPGGIVAGLMSRTMGELPLWVRENWPHAGYYLELMDTCDVATLWRRHQQRVIDCRQTTNVAIPLHNSLRLYVCQSRRAQHIVEHYGKWQKYLSTAITAVCFLLILIVMFGMTGVVRNAARSAAPYAILIPILLAALIGMVALVLMGMIRTRVMPHLPGPRLSSVDELLQTVSQL